MYREMDTKDGFAIKYALNKGFKIAIISGGRDKGLEIRLQDLGIKNIFLGFTDKERPFNDFIKKVDNSNPISLFLMSLKSALKYKKMSEASYFDILKSFLAMLKGDDLTISQTIMSANSPAIIQTAMVDGMPANGAMPSGTVAGVIDDLPTCENLIKEIISQYNLKIKQMELENAN